MKKLLILLIAATFGLNAYAQTLNDAKKAIESEQYEKARITLEGLVKANPTDWQYNFYLGDLYLILDESAKAKACFDAGVVAKKNPQMNYVGLGHILLNEGKPAEAQAAFDKATANIRKKDTEELLYIAKAYVGSYNPNYNKAVEYAKRALAADSYSAQANLVLGDAEYNLNNLNEAYSAYRNAFELDKNLLRAKLHLAVITKSAQAFPEAVEAINEILQLNPSYAPAYRELAEINYLWATLDPSVYDEYIPKALQYYEKYMSLTDYSLESRMRHADFLVLAKDYQALEKEAAEMQKLDNVNPRILRYLGYSAYENGNYAEAAEALKKFISVVEQRRILGLDYLYLAKAEAMVLMGEEVTAIDPAKLKDMLSSLSEAIKMETPIEGAEFSELGRKFYTGREYGKASEVFAVLSSAPDATLVDKLYYANSIFYNAATMDETTIGAYIPQIEIGDGVYASIIEAAPSTLDPYYNRARLNRFIPGNEAKTAQLFETYIKAATEKGDEELAKPLTRSKLSESYTYVGMFYAEQDNAKAIANFEKALEFDPANEHAKQSLDFLKKQK